MNLRELMLQNPHARPSLIEDCLILLHNEVRSKRGISGVAIRSTYSMALKIKPGFVKTTIDELLDEFLDKLDPHFCNFMQTRQGAEGFSEYLIGLDDKVADDLLTVTDSKVARLKYRALKKAYSVLRRQAKRHVVEAIPAVAQMAEKHISIALPN